MDKKISNSPQLSPSLNHRHVLKRTVPSLAYDGGDARAWQNRLRRKLRQLIAMPENDGAPLHARTIWKREHALGTIEKIAFRAEPGADVLAYLCLPRDAQPPYATMICLQGHTTGMHVSIGAPRDDDGTEPDREGDRDFGLECMKRGLAALCIEQRSFGERREQQQKFLSDQGCHDAAMHALLLGRTLLGERVFDVDRGLDYLASRGDINMKKVGAMGNSGGGITAMYAAALLPRVRFAMPSCAFCSFADSFMSIYHCADNYIPGLLQFAEAADVMGLAAPKPLVIVAGRDDKIFPLSGVRREYRRLQQIYHTMDAAGNCKLVVGDGGHRFYAADAWPPLLKMIEKL